MKASEKTRLATASAVIVAVAIGYVVNIGSGTLSAPGIWDISVLCPLGALGTMIASHTVIPRAVVSLVLAVVAFVIFGRAFCGWICPVPVVSRLRDILRKGKPATIRVEGAGMPLSEDEKARLGTPCSATERAGKRGCKVDTRHSVLAGAIISTAIFGFPVFCLVCPIGLTFASIMLIINLFATGDVTWSVIAIPALLVVEVILLRKWCYAICPLSALMSLGGKLNRTFVPSIDDAKCLETSKGVKCGRCSAVCTEGIDIRHTQLSKADLSECIKCRACVEHCPSKAVDMPLLPAKKEDVAAVAPQAE